MRPILRHAILPVVVAAIVGYAVVTGSPGVSSLGGSLGVSSATSTANLPWPISLVAPAVAHTVGRPIASTSQPATTAPTAAIQAVIQKANQEQATAFTTNNPTVMKDTATSGYYNQLVQINQSMASAGVTSIKLINLQWGQITLQGANAAQATTVETWQTTYADGSVDQNQDRNVYTLVQVNGSWMIQTDDHPDAVVSDPTGVTLPNPSIPTLPTLPTLPTSPIGPSGVVPGTLPAPSGQAGVSRNWSGYAATGGTYTGVTGTWTVPNSQASAGAGSRGVSSGATWVGIGGVQSRDLIQAGTDETAVSSQGVQYEAWIETLPQASHPIPLAVSPGDSVTVSINQQSPGQWLIAFKDNTTGKTYQTTVSYQSSLSSAEWVVEAPSSGRGVLPLDNFGTVTFSGGSAIDNGKTETIAQTGAQAITMMGSTGSPMATPSALNAAGQGFSVSRSATSSTTPSLQPFPGRSRFRQVPGSSLSGYPVAG